MLLSVLETTGRARPVVKVGGVYLVTLLALACGAILFLWVEAAHLAHDPPAGQARRPRSSWSASTSALVLGLGGRVLYLQQQ